MENLHTEVDLDRNGRRLIEGEAVKWNGKVWTFEEICPPLNFAILRDKDGGFEYAKPSDLEAFCE